MGSNDNSILNHVSFRSIVECPPGPQSPRSAPGAIFVPWLVETCCDRREAKGTPTRGLPSPSPLLFHVTLLRSPNHRSVLFQAERWHLEQRLSAVEARVSKAARNRADLSRRLAETAVEAEEAGVENQRLVHRVRVSGGSFVMSRTFVVGIAVSCLYLVASLCYC